MKRKQLFIKADGITDDTWMHYGTLPEAAHEQLREQFVQDIWEQIESLGDKECIVAKFKVVEMTDEEVEAIPEM